MLGKNAKDKWTNCSFQPIQEIIFSTVADYADGIVLRPCLCPMCIVILELHTASMAIFCEFYFAKPCEVL